MQTGGLRTVIMHPRNHPGPAAKCPSTVVEGENPRAGSATSHMQAHSNTTSPSAGEVARFLLAVGALPIYTVHPCCCKIASPQRGWAHSHAPCPPDSTSDKAQRQHSIRSSSASGSRIIFLIKLAGSLSLSLPRARARARSNPIRTMPHCTAQNLQDI